MIEDLEEVWTKDNRTAPFCPLTGSLMNYPNYNSVILDAMSPFTATLKLINYERGRSAVSLIWRDLGVEGKTEERNVDESFPLHYRQHPMFISSFLEMVKMGHPMPNFPTIRGVWEVTKRGANYGIQLKEFL